MNKKKLLSNLIKGVFTVAILAFLTGFAVILSYVMRPVSQSRQNICGFYAEPSDSLDMVLVGGSGCYYGWQPLKGFNDYGFTSYNMGTDALQPQSILYEVREIKKTQSPKLLVIDLRPFQYGTEVSEVDGSINMERVAPFRNVSDNMKYSLNRASFIHTSAPDFEEEWTYHFDLSKYHSILSELFSRENLSYALNEKELRSKGFWYHTENRYIDFLYIDDSDITPVAPVLEQLLRELLDELKKALPETEVLFLVMPHGEYAASKSEFEYLYRIIDEYGYDSLNCNDYLETIGLDSENDFRDNDHLDLYGATKFTDFFGAYLKEHYELPDHRDDNAYRNWKECYNSWNEEIGGVTVTRVDY